MKWRRRGDDRGETLIELLATVAIMGTAVVVIIGATGTAIHLSAVHREQAKAGAYLRAFAEAIETNVNSSPTTGYLACTTPGLADTYTGYFTTDISPYVPSVTDVKVWNGAGYGPLVGCSDIGIQKLSLRVQLAGDNVTETLDIVIRRPCRKTDTSDTACA
jgi:type II secretory pathway pseudopilin PulG